MRYTTSVRDIKGVGPKTALALEMAGLATVVDLVQFLPRAYEDYSLVTRIADLVPGKVVLRGKFTNISSRRVKRGLHITSAVLEDASGKVPVTWFNQPYRGNHLGGDHDWLVSGEFTFSQRRYQLMNPSVRASSEVVESGHQIVPVYRQVSGLKTAQLRSIIEEIRPFVTMLPEFLPDELVAHEKLCSYADAMVSLHFPESPDDIERGKRRIAFQEVVELLYAADLNRANNATLESWQIPFRVADARDFVSSLPFQLTDAQRKSAWDIVQNFEAGEPMNRLLQGDVGSGKTVVAGMSAYMAARQGYQSAVMAPTELLAHQHAETLAKLLEPRGVTVGLLIGSLSKKQKDELKRQIADGTVAVTVGTHALIQDDVRFDKLGFVVIDEQHRFGVVQRQKLLEKSVKMPHMLAMTATPIPRSLQLTVYGELEISLLRERPAGRQPIVTELMNPNTRTRLYAAIDEQIQTGRQVYVVCPLIEDVDTAPVAASRSNYSPSPTYSTGNISSVRHGEISARDVRLAETATVLDGKQLGRDAARDTSDMQDMRSVTSEVARLQKSVFRHRRIGLLHGKLSADEKKTVMEAFARGEIDILVSTTVVEVGVDVPNATVMLIEGAERFGLAQLHQLRGRVGRGEHQSYCYLMPSDGKQPTERLREMVRSDDGFYLAERDLELRGPGEIYGRAQHGALSLQVANLADTSLLLRAKAAIVWCREKGVDLLQYDGMKARVDKYRRLTTLN